MEYIYVTVLILLIYYLVLWLVKDIKNKRVAAAKKNNDDEKNNLIKSNFTIFDIKKSSYENEASPIINIEPIDDPQKAKRTVVKREPHRILVEELPTSANVTDTTKDEQAQNLSDSLSDRLNDDYSKKRSKRLLPKKGSEVLNSILEEQQKELPPEKMELEDALDDESLFNDKTISDYKNNKFQKRLKSKKNDNKFN